MIHKHEESQIEFDLLICQEATKSLQNCCVTLLFRHLSDLETSEFSKLKIPKFMFQANLCAKDWRIQLADGWKANFLKNPVLMLRTFLFSNLTSRLYLQKLFASW